MLYQTFIQSFASSLSALLSTSRSPYFEKMCLFPSLMSVSTRSRRHKYVALCLFFFNLSCPSSKAITTILNECQADFILQEMTFFPCLMAVGPSCFYFIEAGLRGTTTTTATMIKPQHSKNRQIYKTRTTTARTAIVRKVSQANKNVKKCSSPEIKNVFQDE